MATLEEDLARLPDEVRTLIGSVRLEVAELEDGRPAPPSPDAWASAYLATEQPPPAAAIKEVASIDLGPEISSPEPEEAPAPRPHPGRARAAAYAAALAAVPALLWLVLSFRAGTVILASASIGAASGWTDGGIAAAKGAAVEFYDSGGRHTGSLKLDEAPSSISWDSGALYAVDGRSKRVLRWGDAAAQPDSYALDHAPRAVFVRAPHLWTVDADGAFLRQYLMTASMTGLFFQPLDSLKMPDIKTRDLFVAKGGRVVTIEAETGRLLSLAPVKNTLTLESSDDFLPTYAWTSAHLLASDGPLRLSVPSESADATNVQRYRGPLDSAAR